MNWYRGDIAQAVAESREKNAIFVVYVAGKDSNTERLSSMIDEEKIRSQLESENFVAIRIESDSQSYMQFASIYQVVPVPSIFFIGKSGLPIEIGTSILQSADELDEKIKSVLRSQNLSPSTSASSAFIAAEKIASNNRDETVAVENNATEEKASGVDKVDAPTYESKEPGVAEIPQTSAKAVEQMIVCQDGVCYKQPKETSSPSEEPEKNEESNKEATNESGESSADLNARLETTRKLLEQKRRERIEEEKLQEKERELRRRREGREMQHLQEWQREQELKELKENIRRERLEEQAARERIRAQIAADRAERAQKFAVPTADAGAAGKEQSTKPATPSPIAKGDTVRLQFRLSSGDVHTSTFEPSASIVHVRNYVSQSLLAGTGINEFVLATAYPRYEFTSDDNEKTLLDMGLFPSAVILVLTKASGNPTTLITRSGGIINIMSTLFWTMLSPVFSVFNYLRSVVVGRNGPGPAEGAQKRVNEDAPSNDASKRRNLDRFMTGPSTSRKSDELHADDERNEQPHEQKPYRRYGSSNVHRLSDKRKDSDDENATWNGNSTQQQ